MSAVNTLPDERHFYDLTEDERTELTQRAMAERRTLYERWERLGGEGNASWLRRAKVAAKWLQGMDSVADIGCGVQSLERFLGPDVRYVAVDVVARDGRTVVADLNRDPLPMLNCRAAAALGLFEYVFEPAALARQMREAFDVLVVSYHPVDVGDPVPSRTAHGWVNALSTAEFEACFTRAGYFPHVRYAIDRRQIAWLFKTVRRSPGERPGRTDAG